jgi:hypothetical protein
LGTLPFADTASEVRPSPASVASSPINACLKPHSPKEP